MSGHGGCSCYELNVHLYLFLFNMVITVVIIFVMLLAVYSILQQPQFGERPSGKGLVRIRNSPNYKNGQFQNLSHTPQLTGGVSMLTVMRDFFFKKSKRSVPSKPLRSRKIDLCNLDVNEDVLVWFGHSSYFMQLDGKRFLVDPVFSGHASPISFTTRSFKGSDVYSTDNIPEIDFLIVTYDHYDHLDHKTIVNLRPKVKTVITGLGVAAHLKRWGYEESIIYENDWNEELRFGPFVFNTTPARHFSGRTFRRNLSIWLSLVLTTPTKKIYIGADSGYDTHFKTIGEKFGPFDLAILENGQYNKYWKHIHMMPEEVVEAAQDLRATKLLPVHWGKFSLSLHAWDEPIIRVITEAKQKGVTVLHPMIGEPVYLNKENVFTEWWNYDSA
jgi:L-ascorbate metabolism protein UlaG (beta-lactamase superfamily)